MIDLRVIPFDLFGQVSGAAVLVFGIIHGTLWLMGRIRRTGF